MRLSLLGLMICSLSVGCRANAEEAPPTPATLAKWLEGKEVVEVEFAGPHMEQEKLIASLKPQDPGKPYDFLVSPGEGGGVDRSFINICMQATPKNIERLLAAQQEEISRLGFKLDPRRTRVWSYQSNEDARAKALALVPEFVAAMERGLKNAVPAVQCSATDAKLRLPTEIARLKYEVPGTKVYGHIDVWQITAAKHWYQAMPLDQQLHLPYLWLMIQLYSSPSDLGSDDVSAGQAAIRKAFDEAVQPFLKLEPGAAVKNRSQSLY